MDLISFPDHARVWIYASDREIPEAFVWEVNDKIYRFSQEWISHQQALRATAGLLHSYFIVLIVDEDVNLPGGCSIDKSVHFIQGLARELGCDFFNRNLFYYLEQDIVNCISREELQSAYDSKQITDETLFFDTLVTDKFNFQKNWLKPLKNSWHLRLLKKTMPV